MKKVIRRNHKDLEIYQLAHNLAVEIHKMSLKLPKFEMYEEASQIRQSAKSIPLNVEGFYRRGYKNEFIKFVKNDRTFRNLIRNGFFRQRNFSASIGMTNWEGN